MKKVFNKAKAIHANQIDAGFEDIEFQNETFLILSEIPINKTGNRIKT